MTPAEGLLIALAFECVFVLLLLSLVIVSAFVDPSPREGEQDE